MRINKQGFILLEDGFKLSGQMFGAEPALGEVVFNTAITGYQEVLFDPSYWGQIVVMTAAHIGNTGVNPEDNEAARPFAAGFLARDFSRSSNWRSTQELLDFLSYHKIPALGGLDTRALTQHLRDNGSLRGGIFPNEWDEATAMRAVREHPPMNGLDGASQVTTKTAYDWTSINDSRWRGLTPAAEGRIYRVAVIDWGVKHNILRRLTEIGCCSRVFPAGASSAEIEDYAPDGLLLSNGPGDPAAVKGAPELVQKFLGKLPIFGICLGHQILALAAGGRTYKMKFGHRGINHPVGANKFGQVVVSVHNHGFAVAEDPLPMGAKITLRSLNDDTIEGLEYPELNAFSVQFHPEASPGPHDAGDLFLEFRNRMETYAAAH